ncbi:MAG: PhoPQ-activated protein PqaA family protein, partial [Chitinophagaceae bacterium]
STNTASAMLYGIPNQPLFDGREEDDLQAYTFSQYIKSGDESWPLLFPMVKSVVRAMDAIQDLSKKECKVFVNKFVITGHSKRGHTVWLTAAADARVKGIIPIAIDVLNSTAQLPHHHEVFGEYSTPSKAATDLLQELKLPRGNDLIQMVDAYSYRELLTLPKLIVSATNDPFFTTDALNLYWDGLKGPKWIFYLSNANHISAYSDPRVNATAFAFVRAIATNKMLPQVTWEFRNTDTSVFLKITTDNSATKARIWTSNSQSKDFRQSTWTSKLMPQNNLDLSTGKVNDRRSNVFNIEIQNPSKGFMTAFGEIEFVQDGFTFSLSTQTNLIPSE